MLLLRFERYRVDEGRTDWSSDHGRASGSRQTHPPGPCPKTRLCRKSNPHGTLLDGARSCTGVHWNLQLLCAEETDSCC